MGPEDNPADDMPADRTEYEQWEENQIDTIKAKQQTQTVHSLSWPDVEKRADFVAGQIRQMRLSNPTFHPPVFKVYPVPNGGVFAAQAICHAFTRLNYIGLRMEITESPDWADIYLDDIVDSGSTRLATLKAHGLKPFFALVDKTENDAPGWYSFPWERMAKTEGPEDNIRRILQFIGEDPNREGLKDTPSRVARSYKELFAGYTQDPASVIRTFEDGACDEMVILTGVEFYSFCEHHMLPFFGRAHIAYLPDRKVIGVSKLARLLDIFSRRLQIQEKLTQQVVHALMEHLQPKGAACVLEASHFCMVCRGVGKQHSRMITSCLEGAFRQPEVRAEFFTLALGK